MTRIERRVLVNSVLIGALVTVLVLVADVIGWLAPLEAYLYDFRARHCQYFTPPPTNKLVHLDIDDRALDSIGSWPWPRAKLGKIIEEIDRAGAKAVAMDIIFSEPQKADYEFTSWKGEQSVSKTIYNDDEFAKAVHHIGNVLLPCSVELIPPKWGKLEYDAIATLRNDPELDETQLAEILQQQGNAPSDLKTRIAAFYLPIRTEAVGQRVAAELSETATTTASSSATDPLDREVIYRRIIKRSDPRLYSPLRRLIDEQYDRQRAILALQRFCPPRPAGFPQPLPGRTTLVPILPLAEAASGTAYVDFRVSRDDVLRFVPVLVEADGRLVPQLGLSLAMKYLGISGSELRFESDCLVLPGNPPIRIPVSSQRAEVLNRSAPMIFHIPWFGSSNWQQMYDFPNHRQIKQHFSINLVWEACDLREKIELNRTNAHDSAVDWLLELDQTAYDELYKSPIPAAEVERWDTLIARILREGKPRLDEIAAKKTQSANNIFEADEKLWAAAGTLRNFAEQNPKLQQMLSQREKEIKEALGGRAVLIGWTATGRQDVTPTPLEPSCPGVIAHGVIFNAILTGEFWRAVPWWVTAIITVSIGLITAFMTGWLSPAQAMTVSFLLGAGYAFFNGIFLFDYGNYLVGLAGPLTAVGMVWSGGTLCRLLIESSERERLRRQFSAYNDPALVDYLSENAEKVHVEGEMRELTVAFSDLQGFTTLSDQLGEKTIGMLNEFMSLMVPIITKERGDEQTRGRRGYVNKFLGDGIMFFFGAPFENRLHAIDVVSTALEMQQAMIPLNEELAKRGLPSVKVRLGVSTGEMMVGDAGSADRSDYTVLGPTVNLGSRLESANKQTDTLILLSDKTVEHIGDRFLLRPVGKFKFVGKIESVMTHEPLAIAGQHTPEQQKLAERTATFVAPFLKGDFTGCLAALDTFEAEYKPNKLTAMYREECKNYLRNPPADGFDGTIVLTEK